MRKKCLNNCIFAPYFDSDKGTANFASIHNIFGASNVTKLLTNIPIDKRPDADSWIANQQPLPDDHNTFAGATVGSGGGEEFAGELLMRNQRGRKRSAPSMHLVITLQSELSTFQAYVASQPLPQQQPPSSLFMSDFPFAGAATHDMAHLFEFDPNIGSSQQQDSWASNQQQFHDQNTFDGAPVGSDGREEFARVLLLRYQRSTPSICHLALIDN
ncbi:LOB domain-containing protein 30-like [Impatiens glandulifera]|uniref:LOB domain-containing protein 30-like n=1 Tax=Impatiens glandulifera TaxID=253017 RepID=UPI001FB0CBE7|nr:LOB domain-containing protein 30-like [Impatiens glandulifera]